MLRYRLVQKKDMSEGAGPDAKLFYPQLVAGGKLSFDDLCDQAAEESTLTSADIKACMDRVIRSLAKNLLNGFIVDCGELGSFRLNLRSSGTITKEEYDPTEHMRTPSVQYFPGKFLKDSRETKTRFERIDATETDEEETGGT